MSRVTATSPHAKSMSLEQWSQLDEDVEGELVDGSIDEEEMPSVLHEVIVLWLGAILRRWAGRRHGLATGSETKIAVGPRRGRKPDLSVFLPPALPRASDTLVRVAPHLVVEIASPRPRDTRRDRIDKVGDYARAGIACYLLLDPQLRSLEVFQLGNNRRYTVALSASRGKVAIPGCPGLSIHLDDLWKQVDAAERTTPPRRG